MRRMSFGTSGYFGSLQNMLVNCELVSISHRSFLQVMGISDYLTIRQVLCHTSLQAKLA